MRAAHRWTAIPYPGPLPVGGTPSSLCAESAAMSGSPDRSTGVPRARVRARALLGGKCVEPKGAAALGIAWDDVDTKYRMLVPRAGVPERQIQASLAIIHEFRDVNDASKLIGLLQV